MDSLGYTAQPRSLATILEELYLLKETKSELIESLNTSVKNSNDNLINFFALKINEYYQKKSLLKEEIETIQSAKKQVLRISDTLIDLSHLFQSKESDTLQPTYSTYSTKSTEYDFLELDYACPLENILVKSFHEVAEDQEIPTAESAHKNILDAIQKIVTDKMARSPREVQLKQSEEEYLARLNKKKSYIDSKTDIELKRWCRKLQEIYSALIDVKDEDLDVRDLDKNLEQSVVDLGQSTIQKVKDNPSNLLREIELFEQLLEYVRPRLEKLVENERDSYQVNMQWDKAKATLEEQKIEAEKNEKKKEIIDAVSFKKVIPYKGMDEIDILEDVQNGTNLQRAQMIIINHPNSKWKTLESFQEASIRLVDELKHIEDPFAFVASVEYKIVKSIMEAFDNLKHRPGKT